MTPHNAAPEASITRTERDTTVGTPHSDKVPRDSISAKADPTKQLNSTRVHTPTDMAERHLNTRSMLRKRAGRPRSAIRRHGEITAPANPTPSAALVKSSDRPVSRPTSASTALMPDAPPVKKYKPICHVHTGGLTMGSP